jgi:hypothetical protein
MPSFGNIYQFHKNVLCAWYVPGPLAIARGIMVQKIEQVFTLYIVVPAMILEIHNVI